MTLKEILGVKGSSVHCIGPDATLDEAVRKLVEHNVGSLVACPAGDQAQRPVGIVTERDVLLHCASGECSETTI